LYFACAGPNGNYHHFIYSFPELNAIHWEDPFQDTAPIIVMASDSECLYAMVSGLDTCLEKGEQELNPLARVVVQKFREVENRPVSNNPVLVKLKFANMP
jgi:hypothetical protein